MSQEASPAAVPSPLESAEDLFLPEIRQGYW